MEHHMVTNVKTRWVSGNLVFYDAADDIICTFDGTNRALVVPSGATLDGGDAVLTSEAVVYNLRKRATAAQVNAGLELLPAVAGYGYRIIDVTLIAIGGNAATATSVDIVTTQSASEARPIVAAVAALTRSAVCKPNTANVAVLADGASFVLNDANSAVSISKQAAGGNLGTATAIDVLLSYTIEAA
jgi:hypothetical protein